MRGDQRGEPAAPPIEADPDQAGDEGDGDQGEARQVDEAEEARRQGHPRRPARGDLAAEGPEEPLQGELLPQRRAELADDPVEELERGLPEEDELIRLVRVAHEPGDD